MRAVRSAHGAASIVDVAPPEGDGIRIRVASVGICGSDLHLVSWNLPSTLGHEMAGFLPDGTAVAVEPMAPCGSCAECLSGAYNLCTLGPSMLIGTGRDGGMADECLVPPSAIVPLAGGVPVGDACLVEPLAVAVHGIRRGRIGSGDRVAVVGGGSIGQLSVAAAQAVGATVDLEARHDHQRAVADELGAGEVTDRYDVVVESAGTESALLRSVELCRPGGRVVLLGTYWDTVSLPGLQIGMTEIDLVPASMYARADSVRDVDVAAQLLADRPEIARLIITHRFPLDGAREAFAHGPGPRQRCDKGRARALIARLDRSVPCAEASGGQRQAGEPRGDDVGDRGLALAQRVVPVHEGKRDGARDGVGFLFQLGGSREGVAAARDEQARQTQVREVGGAEALGPAGRVQWVADENEGGDIEALGCSHGAHPSAHGTTADRHAARGDAKLLRQLLGGGADRRNAHGRWVRSALAGGRTGEVDSFDRHSNLGDGLVDRHQT